MGRQIGVGFPRKGAHEPGIAGAYPGCPGSRSRPSGGRCRAVSEAGEGVAV